MVEEKEVHSLGTGETLEMQKEENVSVNSIPSQEKKLRFSKRSRGRGAYVKIKSLGGMKIK